MTVNKINGKKYIGRDSLNRDNYLGSGVFLKQAILKYGKDNFEKIIIEELSETATMCDLIECEKKWLLHYDAPNNSDFYNMSYGSGGFGKDHRHSEETKKNISKIMKEKVYKNGLPLEWRQNVANARKNQIPWNKGKEFSELEKQEIYLNRKRNFEPTNEQISEIRRLYNQDNMSALKIAAKFNTSHHTILKIVRKEGKYAEK